MKIDGALTFVGKWTALDVTAAYIRRAAQIQRLHNPITEGAQSN